MSDKKEIKEATLVVTEEASQDKDLVAQPSQELASPVTPADQYFQMVNMAMQSGNLDQLERMMQMKRDFEADEARKSYAEAMAKFRGICPSIVKDTHVAFNTTSYSHETLDGIMKTISPSLSECGLSPTYRSTTEGGSIIVTCRVAHKDGHFEETSLSSPPDASGGKNGVQAIGSIITYLQRYTIKLMLGLSAGFDNDAVEPPEPIELISEEQHNEIHSLITESSKTVEQCLKHWSTQAKFNMENLSEMPVSIFGSCLKQIKNSIKAQERS